MNINESICIVGIGDDGVEGLTGSTVSVIKQADLLVGSSDLTESFLSDVGDTWDPGSD